MAEPSAGVLLVWEIAAMEAHAATHATIKPGHFFVALCKVCDIPLREILSGVPPEAFADAERACSEVEELGQVFAHAGVDIVYARRRVRALLGTEGRAPVDGIMHRDAASRRLFDRARQIASEAGLTAFRPVHLLLALLRTEGPWQQVLAEMKVAKERLEQIAQRAASTPEPAVTEIGVQAVGEREPTQRPPSATPLLDQIGRDLTALALEGRLDVVIGRQEEIRSLARILLQQGRNCAILVGEAGVGKTCIVEGFAQRIASGEVAEEFRGKRVIEISMGRLVAGTKYRGEFEERLIQIIREASSPDIVLFIDEIHTMLGAGSGGEALDAANILKPALARGEIRCIGATTPAEYSQYVEKDEALMRRFQVIWVEEPTKQETIEILRGVRPTLERHHRLSISDDAIIAAVDLSIRFMPNLRLPDKARQLLDEACAHARLKSIRALEQVPVLTRDHVAEVVAKRVRVPIEALKESEQERLLHIEDALRQRVFGQDEALRAIGEVLRSAEVGLRSANRPRAVFLFMGPTGVGKTETCKALAEFLFGDENKLVRFDMSEFSEPHSVAKLIGAPPGYVGHQEGGQLVEAVRRSPYSVILFDEFDRAHPDVHRLFLQIFDEGRLTDSRGRQARFNECIIILTTNLGAATQEEKRIGFSMAEEQKKQSHQSQRERMMRVLRQTVPHEIINRIDRIVFFYPLTRESVRAIIDKALRNIRQQLAKRGIDLHLDESAYQFLEEHGFQQEYGARAIERAVSHFIAEPIARMILRGEMADLRPLFVYVYEGELRMEQR
ncbi:MAG: ATP-dependent Clp protease ATP-binding subunit [Candidatus Caldarchaeum sp.]